MGMYPASGGRYAEYFPRNKENKYIKFSYERDNYRSKKGGEDVLSLSDHGSLLIVDHVESGLDLPEWVRVVPVVEWLLSGE